MDEQLAPFMSEAEHSVNSLIENLNSLEYSGWLQDEDMNEIGYHLRRIIDIVGMQLDIDQYNDQHLANAAE